MSEPADPGPVPDSLAVSVTKTAHGEGFRARLYPRPRPALSSVVGGISVFGVAGLLLGWLSGGDVWLKVQIGLSILLFGGLLGAFAQLSGWFPVEVTVDDQVVNWNGERISMKIVRGCEVTGSSVRLVGEGGKTLASLAHIAPDAARWLSLAIIASIPPASEQSR